MKVVFWLSVLFPLLDRTVYGADNIACPEQIGGELQACQNCGNEDANSQGHCANKAFDGSQCGCNPASVTAPLETAIVTAAPSGASTTVTGTYALATLTAFSNLRQSITTTVTISPTQTDQPAATAAVVVFAGGVAWYLAGVVGGQAAVLTGPPNEAGGHPDDAQCPSPKSQCKDCGGTNNVCTSPNGGCACEDPKETCPQEKPQCDAETCKGDENDKCTVQNKGCDCQKAKPGCPDGTEALFCPDCGGEESDTSKCSDGAPCCKGPDNGGCPCYHDQDSQVFGYQNPTDLGQASQWWNQLKNGAHNQPTCDGTSTIDSAFFEDILHQFCAVATDGKAHDWTRAILGDAPKFGGFQFKFAATGGGTCRSCEAAFTQIMAKCVDTNKAMSNKGSIDVGCGSYSYEIIVPAPPPAPTSTTPTETWPTIDPHVGNVECFPTHGPNDADKIVSIALPDVLIDGLCMGTDPNWQRVGSGQPQTEPASNNHYDATFTIASNAPELCKQLYTEEGKGNAEVQNFCKSPLKAITKQCVFNGGKVTSDCGEWTLQSCPLGGRCKIGEPGTHCKTDPGNTRCL